MNEVKTIRTIFWWINFVWQLILSLPKLAYVKYLDKKGNVEMRDTMAFETAAKWAKAMVRPTSSNIIVEGEHNIPKDKPVVFIANHQGDFDIPLVIGYINKPIGFIAKIETTKIPVIRTWMKYLYCVFIDRHDIRQSVAAINEGIENLHNGHSIIIFPEGTRSRGKTMGEFKAGSFKLATKSGCPIIPVAIDGSYKVFEERNYKITPSEVIITIFPSIETDKLTPQEAKELPDKVKKIIETKISK